MNMKKLIFILLLSSIFIFSSCGRGNHDDEIIAQSDMEAKPPKYKDQGVDQCCWVLGAVVIALLLMTGANSDEYRNRDKG